VCNVLLNSHLMSISVHVYDGWKLIRYAETIMPTEIEKERYWPFRGRSTVWHDFSTGICRVVVWSSSN